MMISWVFKMRNNHYGVRTKIRKHGKWGMKQDLALKNLMALYILTLRINLDHFSESIVYIIYIVLKLEKSKVQFFKWCANQSWNEEVMVIWRPLHQAGGSFQNDFEIQLMNSKSTLKWHQFRIHPLPLWCFVSSTSGIAFIQLMNSKSTSKWHQSRIHPMPLWCFASSTSRIASRALHALSGLHTIRNHHFIIF